MELPSRIQLGFQQQWRGSRERLSFWIFLFQYFNRLQQARFYRWETTEVTKQASGVLLLFVLGKPRGEELLVKTQDYQQRIIIIDILLWFGYSRRGRLLCLEFLQSSAGFGLLYHKETISPHFFSLIAAPDRMQPRNRFQIIIFIKAFIKEPLFVRYLQFRYARKECLLLNPDVHNQSYFISLQTMNTKEIIEFYFLLSCLHPIFL